MYRLQKGDKIFVYTDGVTETSVVRDDGSLENFYGVERLKRTLVNNFDNVTDEILPLILRNLEKFHGSNSFDDDITMFLAEMV